MSKGRFVVVSVLKDPPDNMSRCGFILTRRIGKSVCRNRHRRRLGDIVRTNATVFSGAQWFVVVARTSIVASSYQELEKDLLSAFKIALEK